MQTVTVRYLEKELRSYSKLDKRIKEVRDEIVNPWFQQDENIGGSKSDACVSVVELKATRLVNDKRLKHLQDLKHAIDNVYNESGLMGRKFIEEYYFKSTKNYTVTGLADKMSYNKTDLYNIRKDVLKRLADELGIVE